jgi:hypothetical protein
MKSNGEGIKYLENAPFRERFTYYIGLNQSDDPVQSLNDARAASEEVLTGLTEAQWHSAYAPGKWTIAQVIQHVMDTERIMSVRALHFARGDEQKLPGFDHDAFVTEAPTAERKSEALLEEYLAIRSSTVALFRSFNVKFLSREGSFGEDARLTVHSIGLLMAGHDHHHMGVIRQRYL